jgi:undecaprenyl-diphosphatase
VGQVDAAILGWVVAHRVAFLDRPLWLISVAGTQGALWVFLGLVLAIFKRLSLRGLLRFVLTILVAIIASDHVIKPLVHRERPFSKIATLEVLGRPPLDASFPSGHATTSVAGAFVLARFVPAAAAVWWMLAAVISFSRLYLGVHYPLDVLGGSLLGLGCAALVLKLVPDRS